jgi:hypothetical protein
VPEKHKKSEDAYLHLPISLLGSTDFIT